MFTSTPPKARPNKPAQDGAQKKRQNFDPNDHSIEGTLKQVLNDQSLGAVSSEDEQVQDPTLGIDAPLVRLVNSLLMEAIKARASDIHIEPFEGLLRVRYRIDGELREIQKIPFKLSSAITSRLKIMSGLDICEKRIPQDGSFKFKGNNVAADFRISTLPSAHGEKIVMRVMATANVNNDLSKLGIPDDQLKLIRSSIHKPDGLVLVTGPTGSGKTTTLYSALNELNDISVSVFTAEDPIEGSLPGVTQCGVNAAVGYTFASILRALLRQDPDVILVGEIRDQETAEISIKAALTGHLVLSTLHTNCSVSTISRLINMGVQPYLITSSVNCVVAQRLVRRICDGCKQAVPAPPEMMERLGALGSALHGVQHYHGKGCQKCYNTGYQGRAPIYEILVLSDELRMLILAGASREELKKLARAQGMTTLRQSGVELVKQGITTLEEVLLATNEDSEEPQAFNPNRSVSTPNINNSPVQQLLGPQATLQSQPIAQTAPKSGVEAVGMATKSVLEAAKGLNALQTEALETSETKAQSNPQSVAPGSRWKSTRAN